jgi:hypothetical protein
MKKPRRIYNRNLYYALKMRLKKISARLDRLEKQILNIISLP